jgi:hypothetical protein
MTNIKTEPDFVGEKVPLPHQSLYDTPKRFTRNQQDTLAHVVVDGTDFT